MPSVLQLAAVNSAGRLWHTIRQENGWLPFGDVEAQAGERGSFIKIACGGSQHFCGITSDGRLWHTIRQQNSWSPFADVESQTGERGSFVDVGCSAVENVLHVCAVTADGRLWHTIRQENSWSPFGDIEGQAGERGNFVSVACSGSCSRQLHVCAVTADGRLWHTIRQENSWSPFGDVEGQAGERGTFVDVGISERPVNFPENAPQICELHVCAVTADGRLWHTIRQENGPWSPFGDVEGQAGERGNFVSVDCCDVFNSSSGSTWIHVAGVTADGRLWHTIRQQNSWSPFGDVEGQAGERGTLTTASVSELYI